MLFYPNGVPSTPPSLAPLPRQHAEVTGVRLVLVVDYVPVGVVHLDALPNTERRIRSSRSTHKQEACYNSKPSTFLRPAPRHSST